MIKGSFLCVAAFCFGISAALCQQISHIRPSQVIDVADVVRRDIAPPDFGARDRISIARISQGSGVWAALIPFSSRTTAIVTGENSLTHAFLLPTTARQIAVDQFGRIHVLERASRGLPDVLVLDPLGNELDHYALPAISAAPFLSSSGLFWKAPDAILSNQTFIPLLHRNGRNDANEVIPQMVVVGSLSDDEYFTFGNLSEIVTSHARDGTVENSYAIPLDSAFRAIGISFAKPRQPSDTLTNHVGYSQ